MCLIKLGNIELDAAEGPMGLRVWPPEALEPTVRGFRERMLRVCYEKHPRKATHRRGRPKGGAVKQCKEGIDQRHNTGKR